MCGSILLIERLVMLKILILFAFLSSIPINAAPYNVSDAFCRDRLSKHNSNYENAKIYNYCILNANRLIREYEQEQARKRIEWNKRAAAQRRYNENQRKIQEQRERQRKLEALEKEKQYEAELYKKESDRKRIDALFENKFN
jgi:hypothetical protein